MGSMRGPRTKTGKTGTSQEGAAFQASSASVSSQTRKHTEEMNICALRNIDCSLGLSQVTVSFYS